MGGLPVGALTELVGETCSGRMSLALSFLSQITAMGKVCAWIDASNTFDPSLRLRLLASISNGFYGCAAVCAKVFRTGDTQVCFALVLFCSKASHEGTAWGRAWDASPRSEVKGLSAAVDKFLSNDAVALLVAPNPFPNPAPLPNISKRTYNRRPHPCGRLDGRESMTRLSRRCGARISDSNRRLQRNRSRSRRGCERGGGSYRPFDLAQIPRRVRTDAIEHRAPFSIRVREKQFGIATASLAVREPA